MRRQVQGWKTLTGPRSPNLAPSPFLTRFGPERNMSAAACLVFYYLEDESKLYW